MKKLLALVLALVMTLGLATVAANADYPDAADVELKEAVEVLSKVGVFKGDENGNFKPQANLDRASAAKLIAYLALDEDTAEDMPAVQVFKDVPASHWAAKYIAYCANAGYIAGAGDGNFYPTNALTGYAFGKMLLCVLGYDATYEGFTGSAWQINVAKKMASLELNDGVHGAASATLTREQAAQYCLNALETQTVTANKGTTTTVSGVTVTTGGSNASPNTGNTANYKGGTDDGKNYLLEDLYGSDLTKATTTDHFGRAAYTWSYKTKEVGTYAKTPKLTYTGKVAGGTLYTDLGKVQPTTVNLTVDGVAVAGAVNTTITSGDKKNAATDGTTDYTGAGTLTEVYYNSSTKVADIVVINTHVGKIGAWKAAVLDKNGDVTTKEHVTLKTIGGATVGTFDTTAFEKQDATDGTIVLYTLGKNGTTTTIESVVKAEKVSDVAITSYTTEKVNSYNKAFVNALPTSFTMNNTTSYDLYLDTNGNVIYAEVYSGSENDNWVYVVAADTSVSGTNVAADTPYMNVKYVTAEGKTAVSKAMSKDGTDFTSSSTGTALVQAGKWYTFEADDEYAAYDNWKTVTAVDPTPVSSIKKTVPQLAAGLVANANTTFVLKTDTNTYKVYDGLANLPEYKGTFNVTGVVKDSYAALVYADVTGASAAADDGSTAVYIISAASTGNGYDAATKTSYETFDAIVDGAKATLKVKGTSVVSATGMFKLSTNSDGFVTKTTGYDSDKFIKTSLTNKTIDYKAGTLTVDGAAYSVAADLPTYIWNTKDEELTVGAPADLVAELTATGDFYALYKSSSDHTVTALYFIGTLD